MRTSGLHRAPACLLRLPRPARREAGVAGGRLFPAGLPPWVAQLAPAPTFTSFRALRAFGRQGDKLAGLQISLRFKRAVVKLQTRVRLNKEVVTTLHPLTQACHCITLKHDTTTVLCIATAAECCDAFTALLHTLVQHERISTTETEYNKHTCIVDFNRSARARTAVSEAFQ